MTKTTTLIENVDLYYNEAGYTVLTEVYHQKRGSCCQSGCKHCPYGYSKKVDPNIPSELLNAWGNREDIEIYDGEIEEDL